MSQKLYNELKSLSFEKENGLNFKLKYRKAQNSILPRRFGDLYGRVGDQCRIRESPRELTYMVLSGLITNLPTKQT